MTLRETLDRLTSDFARQVIAALRNASLDELAARAPAAAAVARPRRGATPGHRARVAVARSPRTPRVAAPAAPAAPLPQSVTTPEMRSAALDVLEQRGSKGATATQLEAELSLQGFPVTADLVPSLVASGLVKDSGFRRASGGNATSPVYVAVALKNASARAE